MSVKLNIKRLEAFPNIIEPSCIYIVKAEQGKVNLYFSSSDGSDLRGILNINDVSEEINQELAAWVPSRALTADSLTDSFTLSLVGDVTGTAVVTGDRDVTITTTGGGGGGGGGGTPVVIPKDLMTLRFTEAGSIIGKPFTSWVGEGTCTSGGWGNVTLADGNYGLQGPGSVRGAWPFAFFEPLVPLVFDFDLEVAPGVSNPDEPIMTFLSDPIAGNSLDVYLFNGILTMSIRRTGLTGSLEEVRGDILHSFPGRQQFSYIVHTVASSIPTPTNTITASTVQISDNPIIKNFSITISEGVRLLRFDIKKFSNN